MRLSNITVHAIEQFIRRWAKGKSPEEAEEEMDALLRTSKIVGKTQAGDTIVVSGHRPEIRFVLKDRNVCVTVLPPGALNQLLSEEELELFEEMRYTLEKRIADLKSEIEDLTNLVAQITVQRELLAKEKSNLLNRIQNIKNELRFLEKQ